MAIIYSYPYATVTAADNLLGTQYDVDGLPTKSFSVQDLVDLTVSEVTPALNLKANIASPTFTGVVTSPIFVKTGGTSTQYLMADGTTTTLPTLQQVVTAGNSIDTSTIIIDNNNPVNQQALIIYGSEAPITGLISVSALEGTCIKAVSNDGTTINISNSDGFALGASTVAGTAISASTSSIDGSALVVNVANGGRGISVLNGGVSISGTVHPLTTYQLSLSVNSAAKPSTNTWTITSDERVKTNINAYIKGLETILAINPITYDYNGKAGFDPTTTGNIGIIAQDVINTIPESINTYHALLNEDDEEKTELYNFDSHALTFILINAVKELKTEIDNLKFEIVELKLNQS